MPGLPDMPRVGTWFRRLDAAWKRMPDEERTRQREEVQQHLEALVAANEELGSTPEEAWGFALSQFGDPTKIGRKVYEEWRQSTTGFRAEMSAIFFGLGLQLILEVVRLFILSTGLPILVALLLYFAGTVFVYVPLGRKYPLQAIKGALYSELIRSLWLGVMYSGGIMHLLLLMVGLGVHVGLSYLASVTKRGWYRLTLEDFKLTLPHRRRQVR